MNASKPKPPTEHAEQVAFIAWCKLSGYPYSMIYAVPNGGQRNVIVATKLKAEGVTAGIPDLFLPHAAHGYHGLYIEMKRIGGKVTPEQKTRMAELSKEGYSAVVCHGADEARRAILDYVEGVNLGQFGV
jgi:hypothetical protein